MLMVLGAGSVWCGVGEGEGGRRHGASVTGLLSSLIYWTVGMWSSFAPICQPVSRLDDNDDDDGMLWRLTVHPDASARTTRLHRSGTSVQLLRSGSYDQLLRSVRSGQLLRSGGYDQLPPSGRSDQRLRGGAVPDSTARVNLTGRFAGPLLLPRLRWRGGGAGGRQDDGGDGN